ncbi:MAG: hypothetical protein ACFB02_14335 [Mastigocoleus sp.]
MNFAKVGGLTATGKDVFAILEPGMEVASGNAPVKEKRHCYLYYFLSKDVGLRPKFQGWCVNARTG